MVIHRGEKIGLGGVLKDGNVVTIAHTVVVQQLSKALNLLHEQTFTVDAQEQKYVTIIDTAHFNVGVNYLRFLLRTEGGDMVINNQDMEVVIYE